MEIGVLLHKYCTGYLFFTDTFFSFGVTVIVPELDWLLGATKDTALILISDGDNDDPAPVIDDQYRQLAAGAAMVIGSHWCVTLSPVTV